MDLAFFRREAGTLVPTDVARSAWSDDQMHGVAVSGALAGAAERAVAEAGRDDLVPGRFTVDLFRPARMTPSVLTTGLVRRSPRLVLVDTTMTQDGEPVARASALFLRPDGSAPGEVWEPAERPGPPPTDVVPPSDEPRVPFLASDVGWSQKFSEHQNTGRKQAWVNTVPVVAGEPVTPFQAAASGADTASMVTNLGTRGVEHINTDLTLTLARLPVGPEVGLAALDRVERDGVAVGTATMFDRSGPLGTVVVTSVANVRRSIDFDEVGYRDDGSRTSATV